MNRDSIAASTAHDPVVALPDSVALFLHATGAGPSAWDTVPDDLLQGATKLAPSHIGYPPGPPLARGARCSARADAEQLLRELPADGRPIDLYAHSYGGFVALELLELLGTRVRSAFLYEPVLFGALLRSSDLDPIAVAEARAFAEHAWFLSDERLAGTDEWLELFIDYWNRPGTWANMASGRRSYLRQIGWKMYQEVRTCFQDARPFADRGFANVPCTIALGGRSPATTRAMAHGLQRHWPGAALVELPGVGHMAPLTQPTIVYEAMRQHRARVAV